MPQQSLLRLSQKCKLPLCRFNCCNDQGVCPSSLSQCANSHKTDPIWLDIFIGILVCTVILGAIVALLILARRRQGRPRVQTLASNSDSANQQDKTKEIQMIGVDSKINRVNSPHKKPGQVENPFEYIHPRELEYLRSKKNKSHFLLQY